MTDLVIEKGIPFPPETGPRVNGRNGGRPPTRPWYALEIGDSAVLGTSGVARSGVEWARRNGRIFLISKQSDGSGWRVWRKA